MPLSDEQRKQVNDFLKERGYTQSSNGSWSHEIPGGTHGGGSWNPLSTQEAATTAGAFGKGVIQGGLGYIEAPAQMAEWGLRKITGNENLKLPGHDWASAYKRGVESSTAGNIGEMAGSIAPMFTPMGWIGAAGRGAEALVGGARAAREIPSFLGAAGKGAEAAGALEKGAGAAAKTSDRMLSSMAKGAAGGALSQPVSGDDFINEKLKQTMAGAALGGFANRVGSKIQGAHLADIEARNAGYANRFAKKQASDDVYERMRAQAERAQGRGSGAKPKEPDSAARQAFKIFAHLAPHYLLHQIPGVGMFARYHAARALGRLAEQARLPNADPRLKAAAERIFRDINYNPSLSHFVAGAQADRYFPEEDR